jgi:SHS family lactate transporter-like MFS transporter
MTFFAAWSGWVLDAFDFTIFLLVMPHIQKEFGVHHVATTGSIALTLVARLAGGYFAGKAADRWGRRLPLLISVVWFALCDGAVAMAPSFGAILVLRTLFGFGMGAEWTSGTTLAMENWPQRSRGIASGVLQGSWAVGYLLAAVACSFLVPRFGWRALFFVAMAPALLVLPMRAWVPESSEWEREKKQGRTQVSLASLFRKHPGLLATTVWGALAMAAGFGVYYGLTGLYPTMLQSELHMTERGMSQLVVLFNVGMMLGSVSTGVLASRRGPTLALVLPATLGLLCVPLYVGAVPSALALGAFLGGALGVGFTGVTPMLLTGLFPAAGRARLVGLVYHLGALFAGFVPLFTARLAASGLGLQKAIFAVASVLEVSLVLLVVLRPRAREPHDDTAHLPEAP